MIYIEILSIMETALNLGLVISDENPLEIKFASYDKDLNFKAKKVFNGSILKIADQTLEYANLLNTTSAIIVPYQAQRIALH